MKQNQETNNEEKSDSCCEPGCSCQGVDRREFIKVAGAGVAGASLLGAGLGAVAGPFDSDDHFVPVDKKLSARWVRLLFERGDRTWYSGDDLATIGMPVGGICAGQVYLTGDGRLVCWDIFNQNINSGWGQVNYEKGRTAETAVVRGREFTAFPAIDQGFAIRVTAGGRSTVRTLDYDGFPGVRFCGEYPKGFVDYVDGDLPAAVRVEAFSPFVPLNAADSALPATVLRFSVANKSNETIDVDLAGWLQNAVGWYCPPETPGLRTNKVVVKKGVTTLTCRARPKDPPAEPVRPPELFADFEGDDYGAWKIEGDALGKSPARGTLEAQQKVTGFSGKGLVNTYLGGSDELEGKLISPEFKIERPWITFLVGGGAHKDRTCINLVVDGKAVRTATGRNNEHLTPCNWEVADLVGRAARIEIVDAATEGWGHINIDRIEFRDEPIGASVEEMLVRSDYGSMALGIVGEGLPLCCASLPEGAIGEILFDGKGKGLSASGRTESSFQELLRGAVGRSFTLEGGEERTETFIVSWYMPNMRRGDTIVGNQYATRFTSAANVAEYTAANLDRLEKETTLWHDTYYDSSLPYWLLDRIGSTLSNLASATCQWWRNGRFWAWEGVGCCHGTCGHVWNYEHAMARLFPELERSVREMQDFAPGVGLEESGAIAFRGENYHHWAGDAQGGYILKAYREHLVSKNDDFVKRNWTNIRKAMRFMIDEDANADGLLEGSQHQTYDQNYYGANTFVGSLYLGALRAAEEMARVVGDDDFAATCRKIFKSGGTLSVERLFNGEYFIQDVDLEKHPDWQYGDGCLADQLFGQGWAHQVGLGYIYPKETVLAALQSIWKYCWAPDIGPQNKAHKPERWFAHPGEAGLFTCTWPRSSHLGPKSTRYRNEIWTGIEYQVAGHMAWEGMLTEALSICRGIHERYHPSRHNPWNEIECGDHYARALASWGVLVGLSGFSYDGPDGAIGFSPRISPEGFRAAFTASEGWGSFTQTLEKRVQHEVIEVKWGRVKVKTMTFDLPEDVILGNGRVRLDHEGLDADFMQDGRTVTVTLDREITVSDGQRLLVSIVG